MVQCNYLVEEVFSPEVLLEHRFCKSTAEVLNSTFVILLYICAKFEHWFFKAVPSQSRKPLAVTFPDLHMKNILLTFIVLTFSFHTFSQQPFKIGIYELINRPADWEKKLKRYEFRNLFVKTNLGWELDSNIERTAKYKIVKNGRVIQTIQGNICMDSLNYFPERTFFYKPNKIFQLNKSYNRILEPMVTDMNFIDKSTILSNSKSFRQVKTLNKYTPHVEDLLIVEKNLLSYIKKRFSFCSSVLKLSDSVLKEIYQVDTAYINTKHTFIDNTGIKIIFLRVKDKRAENGLFPAYYCDLDYSYNTFYNKGFYTTCVIYPNNEVKYLHDEMILMDYGDFDNDNQDEYIFWHARFNHDSYLLYYNNFDNLTEFEWSYH
jgi:hypothetical protein